MRKIKTRILLGALTASSVLTASVANATGFDLRTQSASGLGKGFAGVAAGGDISTSFWNPANISEAEGSDFQAVLNIIDGDASIESTGSSSVIFQNLEDTDNISGTNVTPSLYYANQVNNKWSWGLSFTAPFATITDAGEGSRSQFVSREANLVGLALSPTFSYKPTNNLSLGAGLIVQNFDVEISRAIPVGAAQGVFSANDPLLNIEGDDTGVGFTLGLTYKIGSTDIGLGYRSSISHNIEGNFNVDAFGVDAGINVDLDTPEIITFGIQQALTKKLTLNLGIEYTEWSTLGTLPVLLNATGSVATLAGQPIVVALEYDDTFYYSVGAEYQYSKSLLLRTGIGYDETSVSDTTRTTQFPDNDRWTISFGLTKQFKTFTIDASYQYLFLDEEATISVTPGNPSFTGLPFTGVSDLEAHLLSIGVKF